MAKNWVVAANGGDFNKIQLALNAAQPGDTITVRAGTYNEKINFPRSGGAIDGHITLQGESGAILSGSGVAGQDMILIQNCSYVRVIGLDIRDNRTPAKGEGSGIRILGAGDHIEIRNNRIHEMRGSNAMGITVYGTSSSASISDLVIDGNEIYDSEPAESEALTLNGNVERFQVTNNYVHDVNNIGIDFIGGEADKPAPPLVARNGLCSKNRVVRSRSSYGGGYGAGIYVDGGKDIVIELNTVTESDLGIEIGAENRGLVTSGIIVRNNLVYKNDKAGLVFGGYESTAGRTNNCFFYNNVCYKNDTRNDGNGQLWIQFAGNNTIQNNIFWAAGNGLLIASDSGNVSNLLDYNLWFSDPGVTPQFTWNGLSTFSLSAFQTMTQQELNSLFADPRFLDAATADFHLQANSPAIDKGNPTYNPGTGAVDMDGNPRVMNGRVDIGAHEFPSGVSPTSTSTLFSSTTTTTSASTTSTVSTSTTRPSTTTTTTTSSTSTTSTTIAGAYRRYVAKIQYSPFPGDVTPNAGLALMNLSGTPAALRFKAFNDAGSLAGESQRNLPPLNQVAAIAHEIIPSLGGPATWMMVESSAPSIEGFFLLFDDAVSVMDGTAVSGKTLRDFVFTVAEDAEISMVNPAASSTEYFLDYVNPAGQVKGSLQGSIPPLGRVVLPSMIMRPAGSSGGYILGHADGIVPLEVFGNPFWIAALPGLDTSALTASPTLYAPQYAAGGGYATVLDIVNLEKTPTAVTLQLINDSGAPIGNPGIVRLAAGGSARIDTPAFFGVTPGVSLIQGYVRMQSDGGRFSGSVLFTDAQLIQFGSALPFVDTALTTTYFSHVAQNETFFTGLAAVNVNAQPVTAEISVHDTNGAQVALGSKQIPPGGRFSKVLFELVGAFPPMSRGYFKMTSTLPVVAFALFGTHNGTVLSAIPPQFPTGR